MVTRVVYSTEYSTVQCTAQSSNGATWRCTGKEVCFPRVACAQASRQMARYCTVEVLVLSRSPTVSGLLIRAARDSCD